MAPPPALRSPRTDVWVIESTLSKIQARLVPFSYFTAKQDAGRTSQAAPGGRFAGQSSGRPSCVLLRLEGKLSK